MTASDKEYTQLKDIPTSSVCQKLLLCGSIECSYLRTQFTSYMPICIMFLGCNQYPH